MKKLNWVEIDIFPGVRFLLAADTKTFVQAMKAIGNNDTEPSSRVVQTFWELDADKVSIVITIPTGVDGASLSGVLALIVHEVVHAVHRVRDYIGEKAFSEEVECYLTQYITAHIAHQYLKSGRFSGDTAY
jgi:hypothetical protein